MFAFAIPVVVYLLLVVIPGFVLAARAIRALLPFESKPLTTAAITAGVLFLLGYAMLGSIDLAAGVTGKMQPMKM
jgi:hypothetical protein